MAVLVAFWEAGAKAAAVARREARIAKERPE
jgi:hypothetical protein